jgi:hypothetical protein
MDGVAAMTLIGGGADLNAPKASAGVQDVVVALAVSPGLRYGKTQADSFLHERQLGDLSTALGRESMSLIGGGTSLKRARLRLLHYYLT